MRKVVAVEFVSVDGVMQSPEWWASSYTNDEMKEANVAGMATSDAMLLGRVTYEQMSAFWSRSTGRHSDGGLHKQRAQARSFDDAGRAPGVEQLDPYQRERAYRGDH